MRARIAIPAAALGAVAAIAVGTGCGVQSNETGPDRTVAVTATTATTATTRTATTPTLPKRPSGTVAVDTVTGDPVTGTAINDFTGSSSVNVARSVGTDADNFGDLCAGRVDVITVTREPTGTEQAACKRNGVELAAPMQTASDAIVLATKNASDVGGDCITVRQSRDIFKAGSTYDNWNQLGFDDLPLRTVGRDQGSSGFQLFGQIVLGIPNPTLGDVRADYLARRSDRAERETVTGAAVRRAAELRIARHARYLKTSNAKARTDYINKAIDQANAKALKEIDRVNALNKKKKVVVNGPALIRANARFVARVKAEARARAIRKFDGNIARQQADYARRALRGTGQRGFIGPFRYSYYGIYEQELRPMEIDYGVPETKSSQPIQFQDLTAADQQALAADIAKATGQTTPNPAAAVTTTTTTPSRTTTNANTVSTTAVTTRTTTTKPLPYLIEPTTVVPPLDNLPATTKDGQTIYPGPNCVFPSALTITNGSYPLARHISLYTTKTALKRREVREFLKDYVDGAQALARVKDLIPITDLQRDAALAEIAGEKAPTAKVIDGSEAPVTTPTETSPRTTTTQTVPGTATTTTRTTATTTTSTTPTLARPNPGDSSGVPGVSDRDVSSDQ